MSFLLTDTKFCWLDLDLIYDQLLSARDYPKPCGIIYFLEGKFFYD